MKYKKNNVWMQDLGDRFRLYNVFLDDKLWTVDQSKELLDQGRTQAQDQWNEWLKSDQNTERWQLASGPVYHASLAALHYNQDHPDKKQRELIQQCREMHKEDFRKDWMITSTRIVYTPQGKDKVVHDYSTPHAHERELNLVGPNKYITEKSGLEQEMKALLGTDDLQEVEVVYSELICKKLHLWRLNNTPNQEKQRALVLGVNSIYNDFNVDADSFASNVSVRPARGWSVSSQGATIFYDSSLRGALSLVGDAGNISLADVGNLSLK